MENVIPAKMHSESDSPRGHIVAMIVQGSLLLGEILALVWLFDRALSGDWVQAACLGQFMLAMSAASGTLYCASTRRKRLYQPIMQMENLLPDIRVGRAPIEDLSQVNGRLAPIAGHIQEMLREIRSQKSMLAEMDHEVRQRIANRTEALERKIGSLTHQATRDALTGLLNRRALEDHLARVIDENTNTPVPVSVLMIDVDHFKPLNDTLGHAAGDELLRSIGQIFRSTLRDGDTAFRCGGDEFVVVLNGSDLSCASALAERLGSTVDGLVKTLKVSSPPRLSIGAASLNEVTPRTGKALLEEADKRLYAAKGSRKRGATPATAATSKSPLRKIA